MRRLTALLFTFALACIASPSRAAPPKPLAFVERVLNAQPDDRLPMLIALHGLGDSPEHFLELFADLDLRVRIIAARAPDPYAVGTSWFPIDDPKLAPGATVARAAQLSAFAQRLAQSRPTVGLPVITGFSQGGILSFAAAAYHAEHFSAALPIAGSLLDSLPRYHKAKKGFVVHAFHGRDDTRIPYAGAERTVARLKAAGTAATLSDFAGVGHTISPEMFARYTQALREVLAKLP